MIFTPLRRLFYSLLVLVLLGLTQVGTPATAQGPPVLYLTFDDGPVPAFTNQLLAHLDTYDAKATFFPVGLRVQQNQSTVGDVAARGHAIGNHTVTHPNVLAISDSDLRSEIRDASALITAATGNPVNCFRAPNGSVSAQLDRITAEEGLTQVLWDTGGNDFGLADPEAFLDQIAGVQDGDIILLHDAAGPNSIEAARLVLEEYTSRGFVFETFPACRSGSVPPPPPPPPATTTTTTTTTTTAAPPATTTTTTPPATTTPPPTGNGGSVQVRAKGDTGTERIELRLDGSTVASFNVSQSFQTFTFNSPARSVNNLRVWFVNDARIPSGDRNVEIDWVQIGAQRIESEAAGVESLGSWTQGDGCRRGFKQRPRLGCNGWFDYGFSGTIGGGSGPGTTPPPPTSPPTSPPTTAPPAGGSDLAVRAKGDTGEETISVEVNGSVIDTQALTTSFVEYSFTVPAGVSPSRVRVRFTNDARTAAGDRNAEIDWIRWAGVTYQSEDPSVLSQGSWTGPTGCRQGFKQSQRLGCQGWFQYDL